MKVWKKVFILLFVFISINLYGQQQENETQTQTESEQSETKQNENPFEQSFWEVTDYYISFNPLLYINTTAGDQGAVSPILYPVSFGFIWPNDYFFSLQPSINFFTNYFCVDRGKVVPAEIENRTGHALNFLINIPAVFRISFWEKSNISLSAGLALLIRFAIFAPDVTETDYGDTGTAKDDLSYINKYFWGGFRFFYLSLGANWMFSVTKDIKLGPEFYIYLPVGSIFADHSLNGMMLSLGLKVVF